MYLLVGVDSAISNIKSAVRFILVIRNRHLMLIELVGHSHWGILPRIRPVVVHVALLTDLVVLIDRVELRFCGRAKVVLAIFVTVLCYSLIVLVARALAVPGQDACAPLWSSHV